MKVCEFPLWTVEAHARIVEAFTIPEDLDGFEGSARVITVQMCGSIAQFRRQFPLIGRRRGDVVHEVEDLFENDPLWEAIMVGKGLMKADFQPILACDLGFTPFVAKRDQVLSVTNVGFSGHRYRKQRGSCTS